ncbi:MAG: putative LuxAB-like Oxygenase [Frankiales bacterium]|nr:putative LuxAB-like Oxygenase [Frankiales bacterium]
MSQTPLAVLDLIPVSAGSTVADGVRAAVDLAAQAERFGYARYWFAEHHLNPGVAGTSPAVVLALTAAATSTIRLGSAGVQFGHRQPLAAVEEFGLIDALFPGRLDLGIGRSITRPKPAEVPEPARELVTAGAPAAGGNAVAEYVAKGGGADHSSDQRADNGLLLPKKFDVSRILGGTKVQNTLTLLQQPGAYAPDYDSQVSDVLALLAGTYRGVDGTPVHASPGEGAPVQVWVLGASGGDSAKVAGSKGLRFAASYHHSPSTVLDAVEAYRAAFVPSAELDRPHVSVSADVVVGETDGQAAVLASGYGLWVRSIRSGAGAIPFPTAEEAAAHVWSDEDRELVRDRVETQLVGSPQTVADKLEQLREATGADELAITTITHGHADRVRSYELLAQEWASRA